MFCIPHLSTSDELFDISMASSTHESMRTTLQDALHAARNAVLFDDRGLTADAMQAYGDACALLGQVMRKPLESVDREKVETIVSKILRKPCNCV